MTILILSALLGFGLNDLTDIVESDELQSAVTVYEAFDQAGREITETEEYYIGRAVAANILASSSPMMNWNGVTYVNMVGAVIAGFSPRPSTYGGWHFMILDDMNINALSCPGGIVLLNRGLCDLAGNEDELAAIIAHEAAHIVLRHGIQSVEKAKLARAWTTLGHEGAQHLGSDEIQELSDNYSDVVNDITMNLVTRGYSRDSEQQADSLAVHILAQAGYDPMALAVILDRMNALTERSGPGFWQTHPDPGQRARWVREEIAASGLASPDPSAIAARADRFQNLYTESTPPAAESAGENHNTENRRSNTSSGASRGSAGGRI
ncbi:peptidase M48 [Candidatus Fermentibacteria bacterium]|nr:MAG: peptidase M48 [Candidatus Fermentibacteria bacterium]